MGKEKNKEFPTVCANVNNRNPTRRHGVYDQFRNRDRRLARKKKR
jgi:hypothetical protein